MTRAVLLLWWLTLVIIGLGADSLAIHVEAQVIPPQTPVPALTRDRVQVAGTRDIYGPVREQIRSLEANSRQQYHVVVVASTGSGRNATRDYLERMAVDWTRQARDNRELLDTERGVIILLAERNREIAVWGGKTLRDRYGFRGQTIDRDLVKPVFVPRAQANDYTGGLINLLNAIEGWVAKQDLAERKRQEDAVARVAQLSRDARATVDAGRALETEIATELQAKKAAGLTLTGLESRFEKARSALAAASTAVATAPNDALEKGQAATRQLEELRQSLRTLAARQAEAATAVDSQTAATRQAEDLILAQEKTGLPIEPLKQSITDALDRIARARELLRSDPDTALDLVGQARDVTNSTLTRLKNLPDLTRQIETRSTTVRTLDRAVANELAQARGAGATVAQIEARRALLRDQMRAITDTQQSAETTLQLWTDAERELNAQQQAIQAASRERSRAQWAMRGLVAVVAFLVGVPLFLWYRRRQGVRATFDATHREFKELTVRLVDRIDELKERHKILPFHDPDYTQPMSGATEALYKSIQDDLARSFDGWLAMMDALEQAQKVAADRGKSEPQRNREADQLLKDANKSQEIEAGLELTSKNLELLEQAHETARAALVTAREIDTKLADSLKLLASESWPITPYENDRQAAYSTIKSLEDALIADPVSARQGVEQASERMNSILERVQRVRDQIKALDEARGETEAASAEVAKARVGGLLLREANANPDDALDLARRTLVDAKSALEEGDAEKAVLKSNLAKEALQAAREMIQRVRQAKSTMETKLPALTVALNQIGQRLSTVREDLAILEREHAPESWKDLANHPALAGDRLKSAQDALKKSTDLATQDRQQYVTACEQLGRAELAGTEANQLIEAVAARVALLKAARSNAQGRLTTIEREMQDIRSFVSANSGVLGSWAGQSLDAATQAFRAIQADSNAPKANWSALERELAGVSQMLARCRQQATAEIEAHRAWVGQRDALAQRIRQIGDRFRASPTDRPEANRQFDAARKEFDRLGQEIQRRTGDWSTLAARLKTIGEQLDTAERLAADDQQLAKRVIDRLAEADRASREAHGYYRSGIAPDLGVAENRLNQARSYLDIQAYEDALEAADAAIVAIREARGEAERQADRRERDLERENVLRRRTAATSSSSSTSAGGSIDLGSVLGPMLGTMIGNSLSQPNTSGPGAPANYSASPGGFESAASPPTPPSSSDSAVSSTSWSDSSGPAEGSSDVSQTSW